MTEFINKSWLITKCLSITGFCLTLSLFSFLSKTPRKFIDQLSRRFSSRLLNIIKAQIAVELETNIEFAPGKSYIIMSNHSSTFDIPIILKCLPGSIRMLAKKELSYVPLLGLALKVNEFIFINRRNRAQAVKDLARAKLLMEDGIVLWVSPEGTRSKDGRVLAFKKGVFHLAIETQAVIIPVGIEGAHRILAGNDSWYQTQLNQNVKVRVGLPISCENLTEEQRPALMEQVRQDIVRLANSGDATSTKFQRD